MTENNWKLVDAFFDKYDLVDHHIKSYNDFVNNRIQDIIDITEPITLENGKYTLKTGKLTIEKPYTKEADGSKSTIYPTEARLRNLNYSAHMYLEMALNEEGEDNPLENVYIGELPVMLKSDICYLNGLSGEELIEQGEDPQDLGGYFIVNGSERAVVTVTGVTFVGHALTGPEVLDAVRSAAEGNVEGGFSEVPIIVWRRIRITERLGPID